MGFAGQLRGIRHLGPRVLSLVLIPTSIGKRVVHTITGFQL